MSEIEIVSIERNELEAAAWRFLRAYETDAAQLTEGDLVKYFTPMLTASLSREAALKQEWADRAAEYEETIARVAKSEAALREALKAIVYGRDAEDFFIGSSGMVEIARAALKSPAA